MSAMVVHHTPATGRPDKVGGSDNMLVTGCLGYLPLGGPHLTLLVF